MVHVLLAGLYTDDGLDVDCTMLHRLQLDFDDMEGDLKYAAVAIWRRYYTHCLDWLLNAVNIQVPMHSGLKGP